MLLVLSALFFGLIAFYGVYNAFFTSTSFCLALSIIAFPTLIVSVEILEGFMVYTRTKNFFEALPMNEIFKIGFVNDFNNKESKWEFSKLITVGQYSNYEMIFEVENGRLRIIAISNYSHLDKWDSREIIGIIKSFSHIRFEYDGLGIATSLKIPNVKRMTTSEIKNYLDDFVEMLKLLEIN